MTCYRHQRRTSVTQKILTNRKTSQSESKSSNHKIFFNHFVFHNYNDVWLSIRQRWLEDQQNSRCPFPPSPVKTLCTNLILIALKWQQFTVINSSKSFILKLKLDFSHPNLQPCFLHFVHANKNEAPVFSQKYLFAQTKFSTYWLKI